MKRAALAIALYLVIAEALEFAVLPQIRLLQLPGGLSSLVDVRLLAAAGILFGLTMGEWTGLTTALLAAALVGFSQMAGQLGASLIGYGLAGWLAGRLAQPLRLSGPVVRGVTIYLLIVLSMLGWALVRKLFWPATVVDIPWLGLLTTAIIATLLDTWILARARTRKGLSADQG